MQVWIDNTGLHGAGRSLTGTARTAYDIKSFLQLATLLIFAEEIQLNSFEPEAFAKPSREFRAELITAGVEGETMMIRATTEPEYRLACKAAADLAAWDMPVGYRQGAHSRVGLARPDRPPEAEHRGMEITRIASAEQPGVLDDIASTALSDKAAGAIHYMLAVSPDLRKRTRWLIEHSPSWSDWDIFELEGYLRAILNMKLAALASATYAPAASRASLINLENELAIEMLEKEIAGAMQRPPRMRIPPVTSALLTLSGGNPRAIIYEALVMREKTGPLRMYLAKAAKAAADGTVNGQKRLYDDIAKIGRHLRKALRLENTAPVEAIDVDVALGAAVEVGVGTSITLLRQIVNWQQQLRMRGKLVVLTEIAKRAAFAKAPRRELHRLAEASTGRSLDVDDPILKLW